MIWLSTQTKAGHLGRCTAKGIAFHFGSKTYPDKQKPRPPVPSQSAPSRPQWEFHVAAAELLYGSQKVLLPEAYGSIDFMPDHPEL